MTARGGAFPFGFCLRFRLFPEHGRNRSSRSTPPTRRRSNRALREEGRRFFCVAQQESSSAADKERSAKYTLEMEGEGSEGWRPPTKDVRPRNAKLTGAR